MPNPPAPGFSMRQVHKALRALRLQDNSLLLVRSGSGIASRETIEQLATAINALPEHPATVILVVSDIFGDIRTLDEREMARLGWFRSETLQKIVTRAEEIQKEKEDGHPETGPAAVVLADDPEDQGGRDAPDA